MNLKYAGIASFEAQHSEGVKLGKLFQDRLRRL